MKEIETMNDVNESWPAEWQRDLVRWTPQHDLPGISVGGFEFSLSKGDEIVTPRAVLSVYLEARPGTEIEAVSVDAPAGIEQEAEDDGTQEAGRDGSGSDGDGDGGGDGGSVGDGGAGDGADPDDLPVE